jgi:hypothetical protein
MDGALHAVLVEPKGHSPYKGRRRQPASSAKRSTCRVYKRFWSIEGVSTTSAGRSALERNLHPARSANWHRRKLRQRGAAEGTGSRKESATYCIHGTSEDAGHGAPPRSLRGWNVASQ